MRCFIISDFSDFWTDGSINSYNVGAMRYVRHDNTGHLMVMTPAGLWCIDCPATDPPHRHWQRTGMPPNVTVTPSIVVGNNEYHGWLTDGVLSPV